MKLMIVDDEPLALENFAELVDWEAKGHQLVGCAENGQKALQLIHHVKPDVVFTDIRMPLMDGLELAEALNEQYPEISVVLLTAYRDFEYAHKAISFGVREYLLKNQVEPENVLTILQRIEKEKQRKKQIETEQPEKEMADQETSAVEKQGLYVLVRSKIPYFWNVYNIKSAIIETDKESLNRLWEPESRLKVHKYYQLEDTCFGICISHTENDYMNMDTYMDELHGFVKRMEEALYEKTGIEVLTLFDVQYLANGRGKAIFDEMRQFAQYYPFFKRSLLCTYGHISNRYRRTDSGHTQIRSKVKEVHTAVQRADYENLEKLLMELQAEYTVPVYDLGKFQYIVRQLLEQLDSWYDSCRLPSLKQYAMSHPEVLAMWSAEDIWQWIVGEYHHVCGLHSIRGGKHIVENRKVEQALEYIHKNYQEHLTVKSVAEAVGLSEVYFGNMFKKELGITFGEYLTGYRMNIAKYLILDGDDKIYEIAEKIGYSTPQYFSQIFQKFYGITPLEYKKHGEKENDTKEQEPDRQ